MHYTAGRQIGQGGFASIYLAQADDGTKVAVKAIAKSKNQKHNIVREVEAGVRLTHKNIAAFVEHFEDKLSDYLVCEFIQGKLKNVEFNLFILNVRS
jgi:serine/threonine protein kinase